MIRWWASQVSSLSVSGRPGTCTRASTDLPPLKDAAAHHFPLTGLIAVAVAELELYREDRDPAGVKALEPTAVSRLAV